MRLQQKFPLVTGGNSLKIFYDKKLHKTALFPCKGRTLNFFFLKEKVAKRSKNLAGLSLGFPVAR